MTKINGPPKNEAVIEEGNLLRYVKEAYLAKRLVYCRYEMEIDTHTREIIGDPFKNQVNISEII